MPIEKERFQSGKLYNEVENEIASFLNERKEKAFTSKEIMEGVHFQSDFTNPEIARMSTFAIADFTTLLYDLVREGRVMMKVVEGQMYFLAEGKVAKCPKCGIEVAEPRKTWKMAGRPNRKGIRLQLHIGLFKCPRHGSFRKTLSKQRILPMPASACR